MSKNVQYFFDLLIGITEKELRARYKNTVFGFIWLVANPLLQMLVIGFVFTFVMKETSPYYYYYLFIGLLVWNFFSTSLSKAAPSIVFERSLIKKSIFPREIIPLSIVLSNFIHLLIAFLLLLVPILLLGTFSFLRIPHLLFAFVSLSVFTIGMCLLVSAMNVRFRDVNFFVQAGLILWFYATPIIYSFSLIPRELLWLWRFNPLTSVLQLLQYALLDYPPPGYAMLASNFTAAIIMLLLGIYIFRKESGNFDDWL